MSRPLYLTIYAGFLAILVAALVVAGAVITLRVPREDDDALPEQVRAGVELVAERLPTTRGEVLDRDLRRLSHRLDLDVTLRDRGGRLIATEGPPLPDGPDGRFRDHHRAGMRLQLEDGRRVAIASRHGPPGPPGWRGRPLLFLALVGGAIGVGAYPLARGITRRLEATRDAVAAWGQGDLDARAPVEGSDEVAAVAAAFNDAAARVAATVASQRRTLASVSHELRSPLARVRLALELLDDGSGRRADVLAGAVRDVEELDATVGDLLEVGRLQAQGLGARVAVDLRALLAEEAAHTGARVEGPAREVEGDPGLLRRLVRNLLENAARHGGGEVEARTTAEGFEVADRGPGVRPEDRELIFEPFHRPAGHSEGADGGVGLGLWLVREIATRHGGSVRCEPREGGGARFVVRLPRREPRGAV